MSDARTINPYFHVDYCKHDAPGADPRGGLWGLETPFQFVSYSKVSTSVNCFTGTVYLLV